MSPDPWRAALPPPPEPIEWDHRKHNVAPHPVVGTSGAGVQFQSVPAIVNDVEIRWIESNRGRLEFAVAGIGVTAVLFSVLAIGILAIVGRITESTVHVVGYVAAGVGAALVGASVGYLTRTPPRNGAEYAIRFDPPAVWVRARGGAETTERIDPTIPLTLEFAPIRTAELQVRVSFKQPFQCHLFALGETGRRVTLTRLDLASIPSERASAATGFAVLVAARMGMPLEVHVGRPERST
jgi:hypothetical protein